MSQISTINDFSRLNHYNLIKMKLILYLYCWQGGKDSRISHDFMIFVKFSIETRDLLLDKTLGHFLWSNLWENPGIYDISKYKIPYVELVRHIITLIASLFSVKQQNSIFSQSRPGIARWARWVTNNSGLGGKTWSGAALGQCTFSYPETWKLPYFPPLRQFW